MWSNSHCLLAVNIRFWCRFDDNLQSKGYVISGSLANALLSVTYQMATVGHRDFMPDADDVQGPSAGGQVWDDAYYAVRR